MLLIGWGVEPLKFGSALASSAIPIGHRINTTSGKSCSICCNASDHDNATPLFHMLRSGLSPDKDRTHVNRNHTVEVLKGKSVDRAPEKNPGIVLTRIFRRPKASTLLLTASRTSVALALSAWMASTLPPRPSISATKVNAFSWALE